MVCLTATATPEVSKDMCKKFDIKDENCVQTSFHRGNLHLACTPVMEYTRDDILVERLNSREGGKGATIIYVTRQNTTEQVADMLKGRGFNAFAYHAGMKNDDRKEVQEKFRPTRFSGCDFCKHVNQIIKIVANSINFRGNSYKFHLFIDDQNIDFAETGSRFIYEFR